MVKEIIIYKRSSVIPGNEYIPSCMGRRGDSRELTYTYMASEISKIFSTLGMSVCKSYADYTGKASSDNDIQLMVYSVRN